MFACESVLLVDDRSNQMYSNERWHDESANDRRRVGFHETIGLLGYRWTKGVCVPIGLLIARWETA